MENSWGTYLHVVDVGIYPIGPKVIKLELKMEEMPNHLKREGYD